MPGPCPFCAVEPARVVARNRHAFAIRDGYPVSPGHTLVIPFRHVASWFEATPEERAALMALVDEVREALDAEEPRPDGYNLGINVGEAAGQTVMHLHLHVIPRYDGDVDDPRGGVRYVIPQRGSYPEAGFVPTVRELGPREPPLSTGGPDDAFLRHLRPLIHRATDISIVAAFVQDSGLQAVGTSLRDAVARGARVRLITGDYLHITQARALRRLLDWMEATATLASAEPDASDPFPAGTLEVRVVETASLGGRAFHPKSWCFVGEEFGVAWVGSSNLSSSALRHGVEWNLRVERERDPTAFERVLRAFDAQWAGARVLEAGWVAGYAERAWIAERPLPLGEEEAEPAPPAPEPNEVQHEALDALSTTRAMHRQRALVVLATGLGKTFLAAFDAKTFGDQCEGGARVLVLAHRQEILVQAADTFRRVFPDARFGWFAGDRSDLDGDVVLASVQKLSRPEHLQTLSPDTFDYVVVDEVHHAPAASYRRILAHLEPGFLLGLTATPERTDSADVLGLFDDNLPCRIDLGEGIHRGLLVPFRYHGLRDTTDYAPIPWRSGRFDHEELSRAVQTVARMERLWEAWQRIPGTRTLVFCASVAHAGFVRDWLAARGQRVEAVHSRPGSADREEAIERLHAGGLDALCAVDLFNEGLDVPLVDRVVMLRPTESPVLFLQQLGRGLRRAEGKDALQVVDFVGNHRVFLDRVRTLLSLGERHTSLREFVDQGKAPDLPPGCSLDIEVEAVDLLRRLLPRSSRSEVVRVYRELRTSRDRRPTAGELIRLGLNPGALRKGHGSWFGFVADEGDLDLAGLRAWKEGSRWLRHLETTAMSKCFKMVVLEVLVEAEALHAGMDLARLARRSHAYLTRSPELMRDLDSVKALDDPRRPDPDQWLRYWRVNPIAAWTGGRWFAVEGDHLVSRVPCPEDAEGAQALAEMTRELVDWRLVQYRRRQTAGVGVTGASFTAKVSWNQRDPILFLPTGDKRAAVPTGETDVRLPDGTPWRFRFRKVAVNVARPVGAHANQLPDLLRTWFGPAAGRPGTDAHVRFFPSPDGWWVEPWGQLVPLAERGRVVAYPSLQAAAGAVASSSYGELDREEVVIPGVQTTEGQFAVRASGDSMDGGSNPIRDGDWVVMRLARGLGLGAVRGRVALVARGDARVGQTHHLKRVVEDGGRFWLRSDNPDVEAMPADEDTVVIAVALRVVRPEELAPPVGTRHGDPAEAFGLSEAPRGPWSRVDGHLFVLVEGERSMAAPDRVEVVVPDRRPGETAYVLTRAGDGWRYSGIGRWDGSGWGFDAVDFSTWRALGKGRRVSRTLEDRWLRAASRLVDEVFEERGEGAWIEERGKRCQLVRRAKGGGVRISGGPGGFSERTVSLVDLGWVLRAAEEARGTGGLLDEALVNRLRYLEGTPKVSTKWIDTGWALVLWEASR